MSLNGLDAIAVVEAHQSTLADPGGWFLLKYANRDTVVLLSQGNGGVAEAKGVVEQYEEKSPLHGMLQYRRKRVLLKYVPEGTSRLLQVRLTVQFQSILDAFPHDSVFTFTAAPELVESALGLCTMLQPTNGGSSKSSNSSLTQRRLNEISEDVEDLNMPAKQEEMALTRPEPSTDKRTLDNDVTSTLPASALRAKALLAKRKEEQQQAALHSTNNSLDPATMSTLILDEKPSANAEPPRPYSSLSQVKVRNEAELATHTQSIDIQTAKEESMRYHHSRHLSENESESISQWNDQVAAYTMSTPKPKKKLAPRPHVEIQTRPKTANDYGDNVPARPVANLPQSVRLSTRPNTNNFVRPGSQQSSRSVPARFLPPASLAPPLPDYHPMQPLYKRPESVRPPSRISSAVTDTPPVNPEKLRLMKALQKRKRDQMLAQRAASAQPSLTSYQDDFPLGVRQPPESNAFTPAPATIKEVTIPVPRDVKSAHNSSTASPTSVATISDEPSTRPSSISDEQESKASQASESLDTDSSSTPKATPAPTRASHKKHMSWFDSAPDLQLEEEAQTQASEAPVISADMEIASVQPRDKSLPTVEENQVEPTTPRAQDRSTLSWLASDSQLEIARIIVQDHEVDATPKHETDKSHYQGIDALVQSNTEESSVLSDEDAFAEELHNATVHEAKHISVVRPPLTPTMRTFSIDRGRGTPTPTSSLSPKSSKSAHSVNERSPGQSPRNLSTALPSWPPGQATEPAFGSLTKKSTLGHGISQRIKALEDSSRRESGLYSTPTSNESPPTNSTFSNLIKRTSFISQFQSPTISTDKSSSRMGLDSTKSPVPTVEKASTFRPWTHRQSSTGGLSQSISNVENTSNAAQTTYGQGDSNLTSANPSRRPSASTHLSLTPDMNGTPLETPSSPSSDKKRFSFASYRSGSTAKWINSESMASRVSLANKEGRVSRAASETSSVQEEKRTSRTSKLMKRMSGFGRFGSKAQQPTVKEESRPDPIMEQNEVASSADSIAEPTMQMIDIGNVNVQFPETLLWKRRFLRVDDQGYLVFTTTSENQTVRAMNRKFHLADVQEPCLPDSEREEIAWSVLLDLRDGNCIQCACESKQAQSRVLKMLLDAHNAYHSLYPDALD